MPHNGSERREHDVHEDDDLHESTDHFQKPDRRVQQALERSTRIGELLLKSEQDELQSISEFADDLIRSEYR